MITSISKWAEPKPGHEDAYFKAMIDRHDASMEMLTMGLLGRLFQYNRYIRLMCKWEDAVDRMKEHGRDVIKDA